MRTKTVINPDDPAFPDSVNQNGMDIRTYIATQVLAVLTGKYNITENDTRLASVAIARADALIAELNKKP